MIDISEEAVVVGMARVFKGMVDLDDPAMRFERILSSGIGHTFLIGDFVKFEELEARAVAYEKVRRGVVEMWPMEGSNDAAS
jgi:hypothetical protein